MTHWPLVDERCLAMCQRPDCLSSEKPWVNKKPVDISLVLKPSTVDFGFALQPTLQHPLLPFARIWWLRPCWRQDQPLGEETRAREVTGGGGGDGVQRWLSSWPFLFLMPAIVTVVAIVDVDHCQHCFCCRRRQWRPLLRPLLPS